MVKPSRVLDEHAQEASVPYPETRLARQAARARPRLAILLALGVAGFLLEALLARNVGWVIGAAALVALTWGVYKGKLTAAIGATFAAAIALLVPAIFALVVGAEQGAVVLLAFIAVWGLAMLPDAVVLLRDFELQHAYGLWARR